MHFPIIFQKNPPKIPSFCFQEVLTKFTPFPYSEGKYQIISFYLINFTLLVYLENLLFSTWGTEPNKSF